MTPFAFSLDLALTDVAISVANWTRSAGNSSAFTSAPSTTPSTSSPQMMTAWEATLVGTVLSSLILIMVVGNIMVILAILLERDLQRPQYYLILSLGIADLMVGIVVSPLATVYEIHRGWRLGVELCDFWISMDVLACTSSILHLVAIALDRYWSITDIVYSQKRTPQRIGVMLAIVWATSLLICVAPILGWKDRNFEHRVLEQNECLISQDLGYQVFSTTAAFYGPLILIIVIYWRIFKAARRRIRRGKDRAAPELSKFSSRQPPGTLSFKQRLLSPQPTINEDQDSVISTASHCNGGGKGVGAEPNSVVGGREQETSMSQPPVQPVHKPPRQKPPRESAEARRERKAWRTLGIITGTFVGCWLPFFILAIARPICASTTSKTKCEMNPVMESVFLWLGYLNSAINPIIYTIFSPDFRRAFQKIIKRLCFLPT